MSAGSGRRPGRLRPVPVGDVLGVVAGQLGDLAQPSPGRLVSGRAGIVVKARTALCWLNDPGGARAVAVRADRGASS
jgi:hypothetical protein